MSNYVPSAKGWTPEKRSTVFGLSAFLVFAIISIFRPQFLSFDFVKAAGVTLLAIHFLRFAYIDAQKARVAITILGFVVVVFAWTQYYAHSQEEAFAEGIERACKGHLSSDTAEERTPCDKIARLMDEPDHFDDRD